MKRKTDLIKNNLLIRFNLKKFDGTWCPEASAQVSDTSTCVTLISCVMWEVLLINYSSCVGKGIAGESSWALTTNNRMKEGQLAFEWNPASYGTSTLFSDVFFVTKKRNTWLLMISSFPICFYRTRKVSPVYLTLFTADETPHHPLCLVMKSPTMLSPNVHTKKKTHQGQGIHAVKRNDCYCQCPRCSLLYPIHLLLNSISPVITVSRTPNKRALCWWFLCAIFLAGLICKKKKKKNQLFQSRRFISTGNESFSQFTSIFKHLPLCLTADAMVIKSN